MRLRGAEAPLYTVVHGLSSFFLSLQRLVVGSSLTSALILLRRISGKLGRHSYTILLENGVLLLSVARTNINIDESLIRKARKLTRLKTKRQIVDRALELLVRSETRKGILRYYGTGIWRGDLKASRRNRV